MIKVAIPKVIWGSHFVYTQKETILPAHSALRPKQLGKK
jgi:hypothetical protein